MIRTTLAASLMGLALLAPAAARDVGADATAIDPANLRMGSRRVVSGLERPVDIAHAGDGSGLLFVVEKVGRIRIIRDGELLPRPFLDISDRVNASGNEQGLLGLAFHPKYEQNGQFYVNYTTSRRSGGASSGDTVVSRFHHSGNPQVGDEDSESQLLTIPQPFPNHNGGNLAFGPDGYLWIGTGDGGSGGDPQGNGQKLTTLLGKFLRIDVDQGTPQQPYGIPADNPFVGRTDARPEIWSYGWRNPWRYAFDSQTGDLWVGDVGQGAWEEVDFEPRGSAGGLNYGWNVMEGAHCYNRPTCDESGKVLPVSEYNRGKGISITGGEVYRGKANPELDGLYFYADYGSRRLWAMNRAPDGAAWRVAEVGLLTGSPTSFGTDEDGEIYVAFDGGQVHRLTVEGITPEAHTATPTQDDSTAGPTREISPTAATVEPTSTPSIGPTGSRTPSNITPSATATMFDGIGKLYLPRLSVRWPE